MSFRKNISLLVSLAVVGVLTLPASAQITAQVGAGVGVVMPLGDYGGTPAEYYDGTKYGLSTGYDVHARARAGLLGFILAAEADYTHLSNSGDATGGGTIENTHNVISLMLGPEFHFGLPALPVEPYFGVGLLYSSFSGETVLKGISSVPSGTTTLESASRLGVAVNLGGIFSMGPGMKLDLSASYRMLNLAGKSWTDPHPTSDSREDSYAGLNDDKDPLIAAGGTKHFIAGSRAMSSLGISATLMFGL